MTETRQKRGAIPGQFKAWNTSKPACVECGGIVARPNEIDGQLRGDCAKCGRVDAEWVERPKGGQ